MVSSRSLVLALIVATTAPASAADITVWSAIAFINNGERTPLVGPTSPELTPLGAQQLYAQGATFRARYVRDGLGNDSVAARLPVHGIEPNALDTSQITVLSTDDSFVAIGAQAFLQGLYPPQLGQFAYDNGGRSAALLANGALVNYPLDGYQYALIETASLQDPASAWLRGNDDCTEYEVSSIDYRSDNQVANVYNSTLDFYHQLWPTIFQGVFSESMANFYYAYELYDYASYEFNHDPDMAKALNSSELDVLKVLASTQQLDLNANLTVSGIEQGDMIRAIAGRMLAQQVVTMLRQNMLNSGGNNKLGLLFGQFEPLLSFFALSGLLYGPDAGVFATLPGNGATIIFELYSDGAPETTSNGDTIYPDPDNLNVRFFYRPDTDADSEINQYGLFNNDTEVLNMTYTAFANAMGAIGVPSVAEWCHLCNGVSVFCPGLLENTQYSDGSGGGGSSSGSSAGKSSGMVPAVAGVIGALVALAVVGLAVLAAMLIGGVRFYVAGKHAGSGGMEDGAAVGGFKGSERKAADTDVAVSKTGVGHERHGSWELGNKAVGDGVSPATTVGVSAAGGNPATGERAERVRSTILNRAPDDDDDDMAELVRHPVAPAEHV